MLETLGQHASSAMVCFDEAGRITWANPKVAELLGLAADAVVGQSYWELTAPGQKNREVNEILGGRAGFEKEFRRGDGSTLTARVLTTGTSEVDGKASYFVAFDKVEQSADDRASVERTLRRQNAILLELAKADAVDAGRLEEAFAAITNATAKGVGCERSSIWLYNDDASSIVCQDLYRMSEKDHTLKGFTLESKDYPGYFAALAEDRSIAADDAHKHPATREFSAGYLTPLGINSMLEAPIRRGGKLIGVLCQEHVGPARHFTQEETNFAASVAEIVTRAMEASARREADEKLRIAHAALEQHANELEEKVRERTRSIQLILDNTGEGILACDPSGKLTEECSRVVADWFGAPQSGQHAASFLFGEGSAARFAFELGLGEIVEDVMPFELTSDQMPSAIQRGERTYRLRYRQVLEGGVMSRLLMIVRDATAEVAAERAERQAREMQVLVGHLLRDRRGFHAFVNELDQLTTDLTATADVILRRRILHTIKGNAAIFGLSAISTLAHQIEDLSAEQDGVLTADMLAPLVAMWSETKARIQSAFGGESSGIELTEEEYREFLKELSVHMVADAVIARVQSWQAVPAASVLNRLAAQADRVARQLGKEVAVEVTGGDLRIPGREMAGFWSSLVHVVRNAVDHGLEAPEVRVQAGKPSQGKLVLSATRQQESLVVEVADDGNGIDWDRVRAKAISAGLPANNQQDLIGAVFSDGVSTRDEATELSGRGVGLAAVRAACIAHGGTADIETTPGAGTRFRFVVPLARKAA